MATLSLDLLADALINGEIDGTQFDHESSQVVNMNRLLQLIEDHPHVNSFELAEKMELNHCTILIYCRWLESCSFIEIAHLGQGGVCQYLRI